MIVQLTIALNLRGLPMQILSVVLYVHSLTALYINVALDIVLKLLQNHTNHLLIDSLKWTWRKRSFLLPELLMNCTS